MIVIFQLSERRYFVLNVPDKPNNWHCTEVIRTGLGYMSANAEVIAGPVPWRDAYAAASKYATETNQLLPPPNRKADA